MTAAARPTEKATSIAAKKKLVRKQPPRAVRPAGFERSESVGPATARLPRSAPAAVTSKDAVSIDQIPELDDRFDSPAAGSLRSAGPIKRSVALVEELESSEPAEADFADALARAPQETAPETPQEIDERRERLRAQLTRPFKQMRQISPFYDYEPDSELQQTDRCFNLCPRPGSPDCPECEEPGPDGIPSNGGIVCPECPVEINLRETARLVGSVNDFPVRNFAHMHYCWEPTNLYSLPLYFEDHCLERYGHTRHYLIQPAFSVGLFCAQLVGLPYQMTIDPICKKRYALGWYRPGQYVPYKYYQVPWNTEAALVEAGVIAGSYFLFAPGVGP